MNIKEKTHKIIVLEDTDALDDWIKTVEKRSSGMASILRMLEQNKSMPLEELLDLSGASRSSVQSLLKRGYIRIEEEETYRDPWPVDLRPIQPPELTSEQLYAVRKIENSIEKQRAVS